MFVIFALIVCRATICIGVEHADDARGSANPEIFSNIKAIQCGGKTIAVTTSCVMVEEGLPYCYSQNVTFLKSNEEIEKSVTYIYRFDGGHQELIADASCIVSDGKARILLGKTNFGICKICEWVDVFTNDGHYIGSTEGMYGSINFRRKILPFSTISRYLAGDHFGTIQIFRAKN